jgi:hypothetical protein
MHTTPKKFSVCMLYLKKKITKPLSLQKWDMFKRCNSGLVQ